MGSLISIQERSLNTAVRNIPLANGKKFLVCTVVVDFNIKHLQHHWRPANSLAEEQKLMRLVSLSRARILSVQSWVGRTLQEEGHPPVIC